MRTSFSSLVLLGVGCATQPQPAEASTNEAEAIAGTETIPVVSVCIPMDDQPPIAPTFFVHLEQEAHVELAHDSQRHEVWTTVHRDDGGYRVHVRHVANGDVAVDGEASVQPGAPAKIDRSDTIVQLDLETEEELRAKGRAGADLTVDGWCQSI